MKSSQLLVLCALLSLNSLPAQNQLEFARTEVIPIEDSATDRSYELYVRLPEGYPKTDTTHPVIYYSDALWHVEMLSGTTEYMLENAILVGISWEQNLGGDLGALGAHGSRFRDYSIRESSNSEHQAKYQMGQAANHLSFIRTAVIPYVEKHYQVDAEHAAYFGYSLGGEFGTYILLTQPDTFTHYILGSPTLKGELSHLKTLAEKMAKPLKAHVFVSHGSLEEGLPELITEFGTLLQDRSGGNFTLTKAVLEGSHQTAFPPTVVRSVRWFAEMVPSEP